MRRTGGCWMRWLETPNDCFANPLALQLNVMNAAKKWTAISIDDYLAGELCSEIRHEFVDGMVYTMVGGKRSRSQLITRSMTSLGCQMEENSCEPLGSDFKSQGGCLPTQYFR